MPRCSLMSMGTPFFISKLKFSYDKYSVDKFWTKIYCHFYVRGITLIRYAALSSEYTFKKLAVVVDVLQTAQNLVISRCLFAGDGKEMYKDL